MQYRCDARFLRRNDISAISSHSSHGGAKNLSGIIAKLAGRFSVKDRINFSSVLSYVTGAGGRDSDGREPVVKKSCATESGKTTTADSERVENRATGA